MAKRRRPAPRAPDKGTPSPADARPPDLAGRDVIEGFGMAMPPHDDRMLPMVGLGGTAGSIPALQQFFRAMPVDSGMAFVVILHLSPGHESSLAELLQRSTSMPVAQVTVTAAVRANHVYVIPPGRSLTSADGRLCLSDLPPHHGRRVAVDLFFRTLADSHGAHAIAIVLSGADALQNLVLGWSERFSMGAKLVVDGVEDVRLSCDVEANLYRIAQEALHNVAKHARATEVTVSLTHPDDNLVLLIEDNGRGFDSTADDQTSAQNGMGLMSMRERAELIGGSLEIASTSGQRTSIRVRFPEPGATQDVSDR